MQTLIEKLESEKDKWTEDNPWQNGYSRGVHACIDIVRNHTSAPADNWLKRFAGRKLIVHDDGEPYWRMPNGASYCISPADAKVINKAIAAMRGEGGL